MTNEKPDWANSTADPLNEADKAWSKANGRKERKMKQKKVVLLIPPAAKPSLGEIVELLAAMDDVEYDRCRRAKAAEWGVKLSTLDRLRKQAVNVRAYRQKQRPRQQQYDPNDLKDRVQHILDTEGILDLWIEDWNKVMAGETRNAKLLYLIATSRLFDGCMHVAIKGPSSGGKSEIRKQVLEFFPGEDIVSFHIMSEKALLYEGRDFAHKILSMGEANSFKEYEVQDSLLRQLMSEGKLIYPVAQKVNGKIVTIPIIKNGPVCFMVTTTKAALHPENETRMLSLEIDDSEDQTKRVLKKLAQTHGKNIRAEDRVYHVWQDFQRLLRMKGPNKVTVPFADALAALIPPRATQLRRDFSQILLAIKAHALIHCYGRGDYNERGELVADLELDYEPVKELIGHIAAEGAGIAVSPELVQTIDAVKIATVNIPTDDGATAFEIGKLLKLDKSAARRRLLVAIDKGFVINLATRPFQQYRLTDQEIEAEPLLPTVEAIKEFNSYA